MAGRISELTDASTLTGAELLELTQGGNSRKTTAGAVAALSAIVPVVTQSGTAVTLALTDVGKLVRNTSTAAATDTIPANATVAFPVGSTISIRQAGAGQVTISPAGGVSLNIPTGTQAKTRAQGSTVMLHKVATNEWDLTGDLAAA